MTTGISINWEQTSERMDNNSLDRFSSREKQVVDQARAGADILRSSTIDSSISTVGTRSDLIVQQTGLQRERDIHTFDGFLPVIDKLLQEIEYTRSGISKKGLSKAGKQAMKEAKKKLDYYERQLKAKRTGLLKRTNVQIYDNDVNEVRNLWQQIERVREDIGMAQWGQYSSIASYLYNSPENIERATKNQAKALELNQRMEQELRDATIQNIFLRQSMNAVDFYRRANEGQLTQMDYKFFVANSSVLTPSFQRCGIAIPSSPVVLPGQVVVGLNASGGNAAGGNAEVAPSAHREPVNYGNMERGETFQKGGVAGVLDKLLSNCSNMTPGQKETWKTLGVLGGFAAGIYGLYKFYSSEKMGFWTKAGITAGTIFSTQAITGEGPWSLFGKLMTGGLSMDELKNKFGSCAAGVASSGKATAEGGASSAESVSETVAPAMYSLMIFNASTKVSDIDAMTKGFKSDNENRKAFYQKSCQILKNQYSQEAMESFQVQFSDKFDEDGWKKWLASFGITDSTDRNESVYGLSDNAIMNTTILEKFKTDNGVKETGNKGLKEYVDNKKSSNKPIDVDDLNKHIGIGGWFVTNKEATNTERPIDTQNKKSLVNKVQLLPITSKERKDELKQAIQDFYDKRSIDAKPRISEFSLGIENGLLVVTSHGGYKTKINMSTLTLESKNGVNMTLSSLSEALDAADLTNDILKITNKKKPANHPVKESPFQYQRGQKAICFNDSKTRSLGLDTRIKSISRIWGRSDIDRNASTYANYLSDRRKDINKISLAKYPFVKKLGIDFYSDENEVKRLDDWLKKVKNDISTFVAPKGIKPFRIELTGIKPVNKLIFKKVKALNEREDHVFSETIFDLFPTLKANEKAFLDAINEEKNGMFKYQV